MCGVVKPRSEFVKKNDRASGMSSACKPCHAENNKKFRPTPVETDLRDRPTGVYYWRDHAGTPVYVGIATEGNLAQRTSAHRNAEYSWTDYAVAPEEFEFVYPNREEAEKAEGIIIKALVAAGIDLVNKVHNSKNSPQHYISVIEKIRKLAK